MIVKIELPAGRQPKIGLGKVVAPTSYRKSKGTTSVANERTGFQSRDGATQFHYKDN